MKYLTFILVLFISSVSDTHYPEKYDKLINKEITKLFGKTEIVKNQLDIPDTLSFSDDNSMYHLKINDSIVGIMAINKVNACKVNGCSKPDPFYAGRYDHFYYFVVFDTNYSILKIKVLDYQSDYGYEICSKSWLTQFIGQKGCKLSYGNEIDAISGATVSGNAIVTDVQLICELIKKMDNLEILSY